MTTELDELLMAPGPGGHSDPNSQPRNMSAAARRRRRLRRLSVTLLVFLVVAGLGIYSAAVALATLPEPTVELAAEAEQQTSVDPALTQAVVDAQPLPTGVGWQHLDAAWANDPTAYSIASISKIVTLLVCLEQQPLEAGSPGATYVWTEADAARSDEYLSRDGIAFPIPVGTEMTQQQMLTLMLLPSANDVASAYAYSVFGDNDAFVAAAADWASRNELSSLVIVEPTGLDEGNVANAADLVRLGRLALDEPAITQFSGLQTADLPWGIGTVTNTNLLLGSQPNMLGLKTGRSSSAGFNLLAAQQIDSNGRELVKISVTLARASEEDRVASSAGVLNAMDPLPQGFEYVAEGEAVGTATTVDGAEIPLVTAGAAGGVLVPGETATRITELTPLSEGASGQAAGLILVESPAGPQEVPVVTTAAVVEPDFWWRFTNPGKVFG